MNQELDKRGKASHTVGVLIGAVTVGVLSHIIEIWLATVLVVASAIIAFGLYEAAAGWLNDNTPDFLDNHN